MAQRTYSIPFNGTVTVTVNEREVEVEIDLADMAEDIAYDYEARYSDEEKQTDADIIREALMASPMNLSIKHKLYK